MGKRTKPVPPAPPSRPIGYPYPRDVKAELAAIDAAHKRICKSKKSIRAFLTRAGILGEDGQLAERYR